MNGVETVAVQPVRWILAYDFEKVHSIETTNKNRDEVREKTIAAMKMTAIAVAVVNRNSKILNKDENEIERMMKPFLSCVSILAIRSQFHSVSLSLSPGVCVRAYEHLYRQQYEYVYA